MRLLLQRLISVKDEDHLGILYLLTKEGWIKSIMHDFYQQRQALSRFFVGAMILTDPVLSVICRELKRVSPDVRIETDQIKNVLQQEVIKREVLEGDKHAEARRAITRAEARILRAQKTSDAPPPQIVPESDSPPEPSHAG